MSHTICLKPIGVIHTPHRDADRTPIQPVYAPGVPGTAEVFAQFEEGLTDLDGFSHLWLLYPFDRAGAAKLTVKPYLEDAAHGVFATRAPTRPNPIGISLVRLVRREGRVLHLEDVDILDATPLLDIKPYVQRFDVREDARCGWIDRIDEAAAQARGRRRPAGPAAARHTAVQDLYPDDLAHCYGCGRLNDHGLHVRSFWDGDETVASLTPRSHHTAIPGYVYGGLIASLVDCHGTGSAALAAYRAAGREPGTDPPLRFVTASLKVDYLRPTPMGVPLTARGHIMEVKPRKVVVDVTVSANGEVYARGSVVAVLMPEDMLRKNG
jgi:tRNA-Thr(GGU) m(6)t(6)A37 methyltransferase TsaA